MSATIAVAQAARRELQGFDGALIAPDDAGYDEARTVYNAMIDRRPAVVARCASEADVAATIAFARRHDLALAVRGGGHNGGGLGVVDDGVVLDLSALDAIEIDSSACVARVGGGCRWGQVDARTHEHGLATPSGIISTTGVGGLTLGGGIGHITRKYGLTIDNLLGATVVLADGETARASADENVDLFWALRGGGGNFGVVTSFEFRLHPVHTVFAGPTMWALEDAADVMRAYREILPTLPREVNGFFAFMIVPPVDLFPPELHLRKVCAVMWCSLASEEDTAAALAPMLAVGSPLLHGVGPVPFPALQSLFDGLYTPGLQWYWRADFLRTLPDAAIEQHLAFVETLPTMHSTMHLYAIDGAVHDVRESDTPFSYRDAQWAEVIVGVDPDPANAALIRNWTVDYWEATHPFAEAGAYVNFMMDEGQERVKATYRGNYERLTQVKATYDPQNVFHINQNIQPAS